MELFKSNSRIAFMGSRKLWYAVSTILFVVSLVALFTRGVNLGVDFTGGVTVEAKFPGEAQPEVLRRGTFEPPSCRLPVRLRCLLNDRHVTDDRSSPSVIDVFAEARVLLLNLVEFDTLLALISGLVALLQPVVEGASGYASV